MITEFDLLPFLRAHECFRRDFARLRALLGSDQEIDEERERALAEHWRSLAAVLEHHHENEDRAIFPKVAATFPSADAALRELAAEHERLDDLLTRAAQAMTRVRGPRDRPVAAELAADLEEVVGGHLDAEERELVPLLAGCYTRDEWAEMERRTTRELEAAGLFPFLLPWIAEGMDAALVELALEGFGDQARKNYHGSWLGDYERRCATLWVAPVGEAR
jgi:hemerythrin-like domain-containing protein